MYSLTCGYQLLYPQEGRWMQVCITPFCSSSKSRQSCWRKVISTKQVCFSALASRTAQQCWTWLWVVFIPSQNSTWLIGCHETSLYWPLALLLSLFACSSFPPGHTQFGDLVPILLSSVQRLCMLTIPSAQTPAPWTPIGPFLTKLP